MFVANVAHNSLTISGKELLTNGSSKANYIVFNFSEAWTDLTKIVVFRTSVEKIAFALEKDQTLVAIPWECYKTIGETILVGVYGTNEKQEVVLPTTWATIGTVIESTTVAESDDPSPTQNILMTLVDAVTALGEDITTYSQHPNLTKRDNTEQHPIKAITGLEDSLKEKLTRDDYLTTDEVFALIGGTNNA